MSPYNFTPLSPQDMDFLRWETSALPMHGLVVQIFEAGPLATEQGGIDFERIRRAYAAVLHRAPLYRQKIAWIPGEDRAVWIDDPHFSLDYHMRHTALPRPGSDDQLKRLAARIIEHPLDRERPLWEAWIVEGLERDRFAMILKIHHCLTDAESGMALLQLALSDRAEPDAAIPEPRAYVPRPAPSRAELQRAARWQRWGMPVRAFGRFQGFLRDARSPLEDVGARVRALSEIAQWKIHPASETPLNGPIGPHRILDWLSLPLEDVRAVRKACGTSINDVVLAIVTGAVREFMAGRGEPPERLDFRVSTPVSVRSEADRGRMGNRVSAWVVRLPVGTADPLRQLEEIHISTQHLKDSNQAMAIDMVVALHEWIPIDIQSMQKGTVNMFVSNFPGPQQRAYLLGSEMLGVYAEPPLIENLGLAVSVMSYAGRLFWAFNGDVARVPDLEDFAAGIRASFERLARAAGVALTDEKSIEVGPAG
jgi:WS/DGAT/MGAT family acyltransferase